MKTIIGLDNALEKLVPKRPWFKPNASESTIKFIERVFERKLSPKEAVNILIDEISSEGDEAVRKWSLKFDGTPLGPIEIDRKEMIKAYDEVDTKTIDALQIAAEEITSFHEQQNRSGWMDHRKGVGQIINAIDKVGIYVPGGRAAYPSTVLMTAVPAKIAGVPSVSVATPSRDGKVPAVTLVAADIARVDKLFSLGGPIAIIAMAFGTESVTQVDKILGPGNLLVQIAKQMVYGTVGIDALQGPTETLIVADSYSNPIMCAADLLAQAEHDPEARVCLVTKDKEIISKISHQIDVQLKALPNDSAAHLSVHNSGAFVLLDNDEEIIEFANEFAPEHLCLLVEDPDTYISEIRSAGGIFVGEYSPEVLGDYTAGPSHSMPTGRAARHSSPINVNDFLKITSLVAVSKERLQKIGPAGVQIAEAEGLVAHANALRLRLDPEVKRRK